MLLYKAKVMGMSWSTLDFRKLLKEVEKKLDNETDPNKIEGLVRYLTSLRYNTTLLDLQNYSRRKRNVIDQLNENSEVLSYQTLSSEELPFSTSFEQLLYDTSDVVTTNLAKE